jgi:tetratricopeptide (TPR) repeat protein
MRNFFWRTLAAAAVVLAPSAAWPAGELTQEQIDHCNGAFSEREAAEHLLLSADERISACTTVIDSHHYSGKDSAWAYDNRGNAYLEKQDYDNALADFSQAIKLDPNNTNGFDGRGLAYVAKNDYDRGIADFTKTIQLDPKFMWAYSNRGRAYRLKGDYDRAIADYGQAIQIDAKFIEAYNNRGYAYSLKGDYDRAIADYSQAIQLDPKYFTAYENRVAAYEAKADYERAIADDTLIIQYYPKDNDAYFGRGRFNLFVGALAKSLADFNQANELNPKYAYTALWLDIVNKRSGLATRLGEATTQVDMTKWPAPVIRLYLGQLTPEAVLAAADDPNPATKRGQICEANFYSGELALQQGKKDEATRLFRLTAGDCDKGFIEYEGAKAELKALGVNP